jgi:hypothetical protein
VVRGDILRPPRDGSCLLTADRGAAGWTLKATIV